MKNCEGRLYSRVDIYLTNKYSSALTHTLMKLFTVDFSIKISKIDSNRTEKGKNLSHSLKATILGVLWNMKNISYNWSAFTTISG